MPHEAPFFTTQPNTVMIIIQTTVSNETVSLEKAKDGYANLFTVRVNAGVAMESRFYSEAIEFYSVTVRNMGWLASAV